jgi:hypothetical protein
VLLVLLLVSFGQALVSRARLVTPFGCGMSGFKELQKAVESTQLNSYSNVEVVSDHDAEDAKIFFFSGDNKLVLFALCCLVVVVSDVLFLLVAGKDCFHL